MRYFDEDEARELNAEQWQIDLLKVNPEYLSWGPHEDYMWNEGEGWNSRVINETWGDFGPWTLNEYNECVNFYFEVNRASKECPACGGNGYHTDAQQIVRTFYSHSCLAGETPWNDKITEDEALALVVRGRAAVGATAESINAENGLGARGFGHDAINRHILIVARAKRLGIEPTCSECSGQGYVYTAPSAHVSLVLWWLHPRKGCSRGIEITRIEREDLPAIQTFLAEAAKRNSERFSGISLIGASHADA